jgi:hypothetical protein
MREDRARTSSPNVTIAGPARRSRVRLNWIGVAFVVILALPAACVAWVVLSREDPARYVATIDQLPVPATWEVIDRHTTNDLFFGTRADRYWLVDGDPPEAFVTARDFVRAAGFLIYVPSAEFDWCDPHPLDSVVVPCPLKEINACRTNGPGGEMSCFLEAFRDLPSDPEHLERLYMSFSERGTLHDTDWGNGQHLVGDPNRSLVGLSADRTTRRFFWSSPTPEPIKP